MKNFQLIIVTLVAILGFNSCSNQFESNNEKKLVKYLCVDDTNFKLIERTFEYNKKGQAILIQDDLYFDDDEYSLGVHQFNWNENSIDATQDLSIKLFSDDVSNQTINYTITLENNLFTKFINNDSGYEMSIYTYNEDGRMQTYVDIVCDATCVWDADKLISIDNDAFNTEHKYTYGNISCLKGYCPIIINATQTEPLPFIHPEFAGLKTKQCPISEECTYFDEEDKPLIEYYTYEYEFDNEGYITKIIETITRPDTGTRIQTHTLTWE